MLLSRVIDSIEVLEAMLGSTTTHHVGRRERDALSTALGLLHEQRHKLEAKDHRQRQLQQRAWGFVPK